MRQKFVGQRLHFFADDELFSGGGARSTCSGAGSGEGGAGCGVAPEPRTWSGAGVAERQTWSGADQARRGGLADAPGEVAGSSSFPQVARHASGGHHHERE